MQNDEQIKLIGANAESVPDILDGFLDDSNAYSEHLAEAEASIESALASVKSTVQNLHDDVVTMQEELDAATATVGEAIDQTVSEIEKTVSQFESAFQDIHAFTEKMANDLRIACEQTTSDIEGLQSAASETLASIRNLGGEADTQSPQLSNAMEQAVGRLREFDQDLKQQIGECMLAATDFAEAVQQKVQETVDAGQQLQTACATSRDGFESQVVLIIKDEMTETLNGVLDELHDAVESEATELINQAADELGDILERFGSQITGSREATSQERAEIEPVIDELQELIKPLTDSIEHVKDVANSILPF